MSKVGDGRRVARFEKEILHIVAKYLVEVRRISTQGIITVTRVVMPGDLRTAKVYVSFLTTNEKPSEMIEKIQERAFEIQEYIGKELRMRYCPKLFFYQDDTTEHVLKVESILRDLENERKKTDE